MKKLKFLLLSLLLLLMTILPGCGSDLTDEGSESSYTSFALASDDDMTDQSQVSVPDEASDTQLSSPSDSESFSDLADDDISSALPESSAVEEMASSETDEAEDDLSVTEDGSYTDKDHVALYIHTYGCLPSNYLTKDEARDLGWDSKKGNLDEVAPGMSIGGDYFGNREGLLPTKKGRKYTECDINYTGGYRGGERIVFSNDGLVYYSADHYADFTLLYGEEE